MRNTCIFYEMMHLITSFPFIKPIYNTFEDVYALYQDPSGIDATQTHYIDVNSPVKKNIPKISKEVEETLKKLQNVIDFSLKGSNLAIKGILCITLINVVGYHLTGWIAGVALTYFVAVSVLSSAFFNTSKIHSALKDLHYLLLHTIGRRDDLSQGEIISLNVVDPHVCVHLTLSHVRALKEKISSLQKNVFLSIYPLSLPLDRAYTILNKIDIQLTKETSNKTGGSDSNSIPFKVKLALQKVQSIAHYSHLGTDFAARFFFYTTFLSMLCYHYTGWLSKMTYCYLTHISIGSIAYFSASKMDGVFEDLNYFLKEIFALDIQNDEVRLYLTLDHVRTIKEKITSLKNDLPFLNYPLNNLYTLIDGVDKMLTSKLFQPKQLNFNKT